MRRSSIAVVCLLLSPMAAAVACLSQPTATLADGGVDAPVGTGSGSGPSNCSPDAGPSAADLTEAAFQSATSQYAPYREIGSGMDLGCTQVGITTRKAADGTAAGYTAAVINGGKFTCSAKEYGTDDGVKPIVILVHGNSSTPLDWEIDPTDPNSTPMIADTLKTDGYHVYASDVRYDMVPMDTTNNPSQNYDHGWAVPIVESLITNLMEQYPAPRMFNIAGFSIGPTVIRDALRRMFVKGLNPFARIHALHYASGGNHGVSSYSALCGSETSPINGTMAGLAACQLGNRGGYILTPFEAPLNGSSDAVSFDTPCSDGNTAYGVTAACGCNTVVYTTVVFQDPEAGPLLDEFVSQASAHLNGANNQTVTELEPDKFFFNGLFPHHYGAIRSAQGIAIAKAALETQ